MSAEHIPVSKRFLLTLLLFDVAMTSTVNGM